MLYVLRYWLGFLIGVKSCFLDGRHFKAVYGKDLVDSLVTGSDQIMAEFDKSESDQLATHQNVASSLQGQISLIRSHQAHQDRRINFALAREAEETDGRINERFESKRIFCAVGSGSGFCHCSFLVVS